MKKLLYLFILSLIPAISQAQPSEGILIKTRQNIQKGLPEDTELIVSDISVNNKYNSLFLEFSYFDKAEQQIMQVSKQIYTYQMIPIEVVSTNDVQSIWDYFIVDKVLVNVATQKNQYELRQELEQDALKYIQIIQDNGLEFNDPYLETYLYTLVAKIAPRYLIDGRQGNVNIVIEQNPSINACCFPNGTIVVNSGLLAAMHTEDELVAILSHEIAHFVLDHAVANVYKEIERQKRAEFWAAMATVGTAVVEGVVAANNDYYMPGAATASVAIASTLIASSIIKRNGMEYNHAQEEQADEVAKLVLTKLGYDPNALASALNRMGEVYREEKNQAIFLNSYTHPALASRIENAGVPANNSNRRFEQMVSFAVTNSAAMKYSTRRFRQCLPLVSQNINNGVATADDYIIKANCLLSLYDNEQSNGEALELLEKAKELDVNNINIYKAEIIVNLRIGKMQEALELLNGYIQMLAQLKIELPNIQNETLWAGWRQFILNEINWSNNMLVKVKGMML